MISGSCTTAKWQGSGTVYEQLENLKRDLVRSALQGSKGNITRAARELRISRTVMQHWIRQLGLRDVVSRDSAPRWWAMGSVARDKRTNKWQVFWWEGRRHRSKIIGRFTTREAAMEAAKKLKRAA